jgi:hypothetical protein
MKILFAYLAIMVWISLGADAVNAYAQNQKMVDWWWDTFQERISVGMVMKILKALQGHPCSSQLWGDKVEGRLSGLIFEPLKNETCLYVGRHEGQNIICCRQSYDFPFGGESEDVLRRLVAALGLKVAIKVGEGLSTHFNGLEILQDRDYIHIHVAPYLDKIFADHGWTEEVKQDTRLIEPVHPSSIKELDTSQGPDDVTGAKAIETAPGFAYRTDIGEIILAYAKCRLGIGYAVTELSKFSTRPVDVHYMALKRVFRYLRHMRYHGVVYWRRTPRVSLPPAPFKLLRSIDPADQCLPCPDLDTTMCAYVDAAHANCLRTQRSVGAFVFCPAGAAVATVAY